MADDLANELESNPVLNAGKSPLVKDPVGTVESAIGNLGNRMKSYMGIHAADPSAMTPAEAKKKSDEVNAYIAKNRKGK